ncbi:MAG: DUF366 family protein [Planctomycetota bacterium]
MTIRVKLLDEAVDYDGSQLASLFGYRRTGISGDLVLAFVGACRVPFETMVDLEDVLQGAAIFSPRMLHFLAEAFAERLEPMVLRQRLFGRLAAELLAERSGRSVVVKGDDLFVEDRKASISVATVSPISALFHFALNLETDGVPVPAIGLTELGVDWKPFATALLDRYQAECTDIRHAATKVRWVR